MKKKIAKKYFAKEKIIRKWVFDRNILVTCVTIVSIRYRIYKIL